MRDDGESALKRVDATTGTSYSTTIPLDGEMFFEGGYRHIAVKYRANTGAAVSIAGSSPPFLVDCGPMPFMTWPWGSALTVLSTDPVTMPFAVTHAAPSPAIASAAMTLYNTSTGVTSTVGLTTAMVSPSWVVSTSWPQAATMRLVFPAGFFAAGAYQWYVTVTLGNGERN